MSPPLPSEEALRDEVVRFCRLLHQKNYLAANDGNVSARLGPGRFLVTPSGVSKAFMSPADLVVVDAQGRRLSGERPPTGELAMHLAVLSARPDAQALVHAHPPHAIALSLHHRGRVLNDVLPETLLSLGRIEVVPYERPLSDALAHAVAGAMERLDAVILERHGTAAVGRDLLEAYARTERLEHAAQILWLAHALGPPAPLPADEARALQEMYERTRPQGR